MQICNQTCLQMIYVCLKNDCGIIKIYWSVQFIIKSDRLFNFHRGPVKLCNQVSVGFCQISHQTISEELDRNHQQGVWKLLIILMSILFCGNIYSRLLRLVARQTELPVINYHEYTDVSLCWTPRCLETLKEQCHKGFAVLDQFCANITTLRL